jgi:adenine phosphoribosyltransferase
MPHLSLSEISSIIKDYPNFPIPGIIFKDIMPIFNHPDGLNSLTHHFMQYINTLSIKPDAILGIEARGFLIGPALASALDISFIPVRKKRKLPGKVTAYTYDLEYGSDTLEIQTCISDTHKNIIIIDDLLATGGTVRATEKLCKKINLNILAVIFIIDLTELQGKNKIESPYHSLLSL